MKPTMELLMAGLFPDGALEELAGDSVKKMCLECGKPIEQNHTGRPRKFCSDKWEKPAQPLTVGDTLPQMWTDSSTVKPAAGPEPQGIHYHL